MIVVALLGIFAAVAVPSFTGLINDNRTQSASNELLNFLQYARSTAVQNNTATVVCLNAGQWAVRTSVPATQCSGAALRNMDNPAGISIAASPLPLVFHSNGTVGSLVDFTICQGAEAENGYAITVQPSGSIRSSQKGKAVDGTSLSSCTP
ncbi:MAG: pilus assembly protein FimT [Sulfuriferula multivorans]|uniref:Type II secretion system protein H n=1 Tax=Sulfuriferula multivorans TaxID=1559896 RepID=A0A7C9TE02_9PROT|nr:pilus assembly protein FimT [Sulfuriferula multivorans]